MRHTSIQSLFASVAASLAIALASAPAWAVGPAPVVPPLAAPARVQPAAAPPPVAPARVQPVATPAPATPPAAPAPHATPQGAPQPSAAPAPPATPAAAAAATLQTLTQRAGVPAYRGANGKVYVNATTPNDLRAMEQLSPPGSGVLQIVKTEGIQHTKVIFENRLLHLQFAQGSGFWRLRSWGDRLRPSDRKSYSALVQLTPSEAKNLRDRLNAVAAEQGPEMAAGDKWTAGHIKTSLGVPSFNCASGWCSMPIGEHGESLAKILAMPAYGDPNGLERALEANTSGRVFGIVVYGPRVPEWGTHPEQPQVKN